MLPPARELIVALDASSRGAGVAWCFPHSGTGGARYLDFSCPYFPEYMEMNYEVGSAIVVAETPQHGSTSTRAKINVGVGKAASMLLEIPYTLKLVHPRAWRNEIFGKSHHKKGRDTLKAWAKHEVKAQGYIDPWDAPDMSDDVAEAILILQAFLNNPKLACI